MQWNVGKVSSFQTNVPTPDAADANLDPDNMGGLLAHTHKIGIHLETAGYAKYRDMPSRAEVNAYRPTSGHSFTHQVAHGAVSGPGVDQASTLKPALKPVEEGFSRQVVMSYGASWTSNFKKAFQRKERPVSASAAGGALAEESVARPFHTRQGSASTIGSIESADGGHSTALITQPGPGLKPKGYVFLSPWNGRCEFRTSSSGRSLKCRHILDPADARLDPREVAQSIREAQATGRSRGDELASALVGAKPVSELRFNLPRRTAHHTTDRGGGARDSRAGPLSKLFHHRSRSSDEESEYEDEDDEYGNSSMPMMDLSLGKENAGGGNRGKRAKLGKLIIHDEGLKMLDLVVAANIGVWWTTWERNA
jgi:NADH dehydrogenase (ubiquinone) Fe-S protein 8